MTNFTMTCKSCRNECRLTVQVEHGCVRSVDGNGCRRGAMNAEKQLQKQLAKQAEQ